MLTRIVKSDPNDYPFKKFNDEQAHLDTDELRHTIVGRTFKLTEDFAGQEHLYCDKSDLDENGRFKKCPYTEEAIKAGYKNPMEYYQAQQKKAKDDEDNAKKKETDDLKAQIAQLTELVKSLLPKK